MPESANSIAILDEAFSYFAQHRPKPNPPEPIDAIDLWDEFVQNLEARSIDIGHPTDEELQKFLTSIGLDDLDLQVRAIEMMAEWHLSDSYGKPDSDD